MLALLALLLRQAGRNLSGCLAIVGILLVNRYLIFVKLTIAFIFILEVAARITPVITPTQPERIPRFLPPDTSPDTRIGPDVAPPWGQQEGKPDDEMFKHLKHSGKCFAMQPERVPTILPAAGDASNDILGPRRSYRRQKEEIGRHLQRLAAAATAADAAAASPK